MAVTLVGVTRPFRGALFLPLSVPGFLLACAARLVSLGGDQFQAVALAAFALGATERSSGWGLVLVVQAIPRTALMLYGGVVVDRVRPRAVMVATNLVEAAAAAALGALAFGGALEMWHLYAFALVTGTAHAFFLPAQMAIVPDLLPAASIRGGNALWEMAFNLTRFVAPLAGLVVAAGGTGPAFAFAAATLLVSAFLLSRIRLTARDPVPAPSPLRALVEGLRAARADPVIWTAIRMVPIYTLGSMGATFVGLPALAKLTLDAGDVGVGLAFGALGVGALLGTLVTGSVARLPRQGIVGAGANVLTGLALAAAGLAPTLWAVLPLLVLVGASQSAAIVVFFTLVQSRAQPDTRGRVVSLYTLGIFGVMPLSFALAGLVGDNSGPPAAVALGGACIVASGLLTLARREIRALP